MLAARTAIARSSRLTHFYTSHHIASITKPGYIVRPITCSTKLYKEDKRTGTDTDHEGTFARTSKTVQVEYPEEHELPKDTALQGRGGMHFRRTLPSFSLEGRVGVITGGARGLGLVMSQALVESGANVAIVDLNREFKV